DVCLEAGEFTKAEGILVELLAHCRRLPYSPGLATALADLGLCLLRQEKFAEAEPHLRENLAAREGTQPNDWRRSRAQSLLGASLAGQQKYAEAEPLLLAGYQGLKDRQKDLPKAAKTELTDALDRLIRLYEAWGKLAEAAAWRAERAGGPGS